MKKNFAFTLIELLVVIAIIAILAVVVVLTLNPAQLLAQSRDANRASDMATLNTALGLYQTDMGGMGNMGSSSIAYLSLPDSSNTCGSWSLPTSTNFTYQCATSTSTRDIDSTGWIPVNFQNISAGSPFGALPLDPVNTSISGFYYTYATNNNQFEVTALPESVKQRASLEQNPMIPGYPGVIANGNSLTISPLFNPTGLVGYWPMDEATGSTAQDMSGNNNVGTWNGSTTNGSYYAQGQVGPNAGAFTTSTYIAAGTNPVLDVRTNFTLMAWVNMSVTGTNQEIIAKSVNTLAGTQYLLRMTNQTPVLVMASTTAWLQCGAGTASLGTWNHIAVSYDGFNQRTCLNGALKATCPYSGPLGITATQTLIGTNTTLTGWVHGSIDDARIYNRALSAAEIRALYNAGK